MSAADESTPLLRSESLSDQSLPKIYSTKKKHCQIFSFVTLLIILALAGAAIVWIISANKSAASTPVAQNDSLRQLLNNSWPRPDTQIADLPFTSLSQVDIEQAIDEAKQTLEKRDAIENELEPISTDSPSYRHQHAIVNSPYGYDISKLGYIENQATKYLRTKGVENVVRYESAKELKWASESDCIKFNSSIPCSFSKYRTVNGSCNNLQHPQTWGVAMTPFRRALPANYSDGTSDPRGGFETELPSARDISTMVHRPVHREDDNFSVMLAVWGQFIDHDITATALSRGKNGSTISCCGAKIKHPECFPVLLNETDVYYSKYSIKCMEFVRSAPALRCSFGPREQLNQASSYLDGSMIYGNTEELSYQLRSFRNGELEVTYTSDGRALLPVSKDPSDGCNQAEEIKNGRYCFLSGDSRANENTHLTSMHLIFVRQHNSIVEQLAGINPHWNDETLYQEARRIVVAQVQHITYNEFLPIIIGSDMMTKLELYSSTTGHWEKYNSSIDATIANNFAASSFRFAHTLIPRLMKLVANDTSSPEYVEMHKMLFNPFGLYKGDLDAIIRGALNTDIEKADNYFTTQLTENLFRSHSKPNTTHSFGLDLVALNIQRGRDHGLPTYPYWRQYCGFQQVTTFEDLRGVFDEESLNIISTIYKSVDEIDLYTGSLSEYPIENGLLGPTLTCLISDQFFRLKYGDRFWYETNEKPQRFTEEQLNEIRKTSLAGILCENSDNLENVTPFVMKSKSAENNRTACHNISQPDWTKFRDESSNKSHYTRTNRVNEETVDYQPASQSNYLVEKRTGHRTNFADDKIASSSHELPTYTEDQRNSSIPHSFHEPKSDQDEQSRKNITNWEENGILNDRLKFLSDEARADFDRYRSSSNLHPNSTPEHEVSHRFNENELIENRLHLNPVFDEESQKFINESLADLYRRYNSSRLHPSSTSEHEISHPERELHLNPVFDEQSQKFINDSLADLYRRHNSSVAHPIYAPEHEISHPIERKLHLNPVFDEESQKFINETLADLYRRHNFSVPHPRPEPEHEISHPIERKLHLNPVFDDESQKFINETLADIYRRHDSSGVHPKSESEHEISRPFNENETIEKKIHINPVFDEESQKFINTTLADLDQRKNSSDLHPRHAFEDEKFARIHNTTEAEKYFPEIFRIRSLVNPTEHRIKEPKIHNTTLVTDRVRINDDKSFDITPPIKVSEDQYKDTLFTWRWSPQANAIKGNFSNEKENGTFELKYKTIEGKALNPDCVYYSKISSLPNFELNTTAEPEGCSKIVPVIFNETEWDGKITFHDHDLPNDLEKENELSLNSDYTRITLKNITGNVIMSVEGENVILWNGTLPAIFEPKMSWLEKADIAAYPVSWSGFDMGGLFTGTFMLAEKQDDAVMWHEGRFSLNLSGYEELIQSIRIYTTVIYLTDNEDVGFDITEIEEITEWDLNQYSRLIMKGHYVESRFHWNGELTLVLPKVTAEESKSSSYRPYTRYGGEVLGGSLYAELNGPKYLWWSGEIPGTVLLPVDIPRGYKQIFDQVILWTFVSQNANLKHAVFVTYCNDSRIALSGDFDFKLTSILNTPDLSPNTTYYSPIVLQQSINDFNDDVADMLSKKDIPGTLAPITLLGRYLRRERLFAWNGKFVISVVDSN
ncbi:uncharacterized protein LOC135837881 [Planococcus citri]|uniref:uncharacterized protein LOC135837881 n=1 Tax=Planococcus citri TaxID=170843 RepID=UPI0031F751F1